MVKRLTMLMGGLVLSTGMALAQTTVTGKVVSQEDGEPVIGASVRIVGTKTGTATDVDGNFTLPNASILAGIRKRKITIDISRW